MKSTIHLIRHGITEGNQKRWHYGWSDIPLADEGIANLVKQVEEGIYPKIEDGDFYTSGMLRTEQTFNIIYGNKPHEAFEELKEMNFGVFEEKTYEELKDIAEYQKWLDDREGTYAIPEGESKGEFFKRVNGGFSDLINLHRLKELSHRHNKKDTDTVVVCHGGVISCIMMNYFRDEKRDFVQWLPEPGRGYSIELKNGRPVNFKSI